MMDQACRDLLERSQMLHVNMGMRVEFFWMYLYCEKRSDGVMESLGRYYMYKINKVWFDRGS
jgi:hypothetical protein